MEMIYTLQLFQDKKLKGLTKNLSTVLLGKMHFAGPSNKHVTV